MPSRLQKLFRYQQILLRTLIIAPCALLCNLPCQAQLRVPNIFGDHMVLQQKQTNPIWGKATPGANVTAQIGGQEVSTKADQAGNWRVDLPALEVGEPRTLTVTSGDSSIAIEDVLVGEVWICSGQSNMEWRIDSGRQKVNDSDLVRAGANYPRIRMISYPNRGTQEPVWTHEDVEWQICSPETVGEFSGVGYFFGKQLIETIDVPIGLINNAWGGSAADAWVRRDILEADERYAGTMTRWKKMEADYAELSKVAEPSDAQKKRLQNMQRQMGGNQRPANIYNGVLKSHLGYGIRGAIWYQGESNAGRAYQYRYLFPMMIQAWRDEWNQGDFPFYWVQLADFRAENDSPMESDWAELREAQTMTMDLPNTGQAVIIDVGEGKDIHPRNKQAVGQRLARWALAKQYGVDIAFQSPTFESMEIEGNKALLSFTHVDDGWRPFDVGQPIGFSVAGEDGNFVWADGKILPDGRIQVSSEQVSNPVAVRYAWADNPVCNMFDNRGLPLTPFRTDDRPGKTAESF